MFFCRIFSFLRGISKIRKYGYIFGLILLFLSWWLIFTGPVYAKEFSWPLEEPTHVTSTLGEIRDGHLHNGIDFSTLKQQGRKVKAIADGKLKKVFFLPRSYGRTVVVKHSSGLKSWYSHLAKISPEILNKLQKKLKADVHIIPRKEINIEAGQIVGEAGATGEGPIHLHFALQANNGDFLNPVGRFSPSLAFDPRPGVEKLKLYPVDGTGWIEGNSNEQTFEFTREEPVKLWGRLGVAARVRNFHNGNQSLPYETVLFRDQKVVSKRRFNRLTETEIEQGAADFYDLLSSNIGPTRFFLNLVPLKTEKTWGSLNFFKAGKSGTLKVRVRTITGEKSSRRLSYRTVLPPRPRRWEGLSRAGQARQNDGSEGSRFMVASFPNHQKIQEQYSPPLVPFANPDPRLKLTTHNLNNRVKISLKINNGWKGWPEINVKSGDFSKNIGPLQTAPGKFTAWWSPGIRRDGWYTVEAKVKGKKTTAVDTSRVYLQSVRKNESNAITSMNGNFSLYTGGKGLNFNSFLYFQSRRNFPVPDTGLIPESKAYEIKPDHIQSTGKMYLYASIPGTVENPRQVGLYQWNPVAEKWEVLSYQGYSRKLDSREREAVLHSLPRVALFRDVSPPEILGLEKDTDREELRIRLSEAESGFTSRALSVSSGERELDFYYDRDKKEIVISTNQFHQASRVKISAAVADRAGNKASKEFKINLAK